MGIRFFNIYHGLFFFPCFNFELLDCDCNVVGSIVIDDTAVAESVDEGFNAEVVGVAQPDPVTRHSDMASCILCLSFILDQWFMENIRFRLGTGWP